MLNEDKIKKIIFLLKELYKEPKYKFLVDILTFSELQFEDHWNKTLKPTWEVYNLTIHVDYDVYLKHSDSINSIEKIIKHDIQKISEILIDKIRILPNYDKIEVTNSEIRPVFTEWEEINAEQTKLIDLLKKSADSVDFQNIGNTSRSIMQKVANIVFNPKKHAPRDRTIDVSSGKFKNQLHSYIKAELAGGDKKELRQFAEAAIDTVEKAIDLANTLTHDLGSEKVIAEVCVIGTISTISIVKLIEKK